MSILNKIFKKVTPKELPEGQYVGEAAVQICKKLAKSGWVSDKGEKRLLALLPREHPRLVIVVRRVPHPRHGHLGLKVVQILFFEDGILARSRGSQAIPNFRMEFDIGSGEV